MLRFAVQDLDLYIARQMSSYAQSLNILKILGYTDIHKDPESMPAIPCVIVYSTISESESSIKSPFTKSISELLLDNSITQIEPNYVNFYKVAVNLPLLK